MKRSADSGRSGRQALKLIVKRQKHLLNSSKRVWMTKAISSAYEGIRSGEGGPFGAVIVRSGRLIAIGHNTVLRNQDATCHAEMNVIREASRKLGRFDLSDCDVYSTTEPCPMCFSAIHWARIRTIIFGTSISDVQKRGFNELSISSLTMKLKGRSAVRIQAGFMKSECVKLLRAWDGLSPGRIY